MERMKQIEDKKRKEKEAEQHAFTIMDEAKSQADQNEFAAAKQLYAEAITLLEKINWIDQIKIVKQEIAQLDVREEELHNKEEADRDRKETQERQFEEQVQKLQRKKEREDKEREETQRAIDEKRRQAEEELYRQREEDILKEKKRIADLEEEKRLAKSPEWVKKAQLADMTLQKAERFENAGKIPQAVERYKYLLELYKELEYTDEKIEPISQKISELENG
jgi:tetratricopeptide (TPR) repeat protein